MRVLALLALILMPPLALALYLLAVLVMPPVVNRETLAGLIPGSDPLATAKPVRSTTCWNLSS